MMNEIERMEMEAELSGREDYLREAFGEEARLLNQQALDDMWADEKAAWEALSPEERTAETNRLLELRKKWEEDRKRFEEENKDCPF